MVDHDVRFQIKGHRSGRSFHVDGFRAKEDAVDTAQAVAGDADYEYVTVVDAEQTDKPIVWDSREEE